MDGETTFNVVDQAEMLASLFNGDNIHESGWEVAVSANFTVNFDQTLHDNLGDISVGLLQSENKN